MRDAEKVDGRTEKEGADRVKLAENEIKPRFHKHKEERTKGKEAERWLWDEEFADILLSRQRESPGIIPSKESTSCLCCTGRKSKFSSLSLQA